MNKQNKQRFDKEVTAMRFPKRFELESVNPLDAQVKIVIDGGGIGFITRVFKNLEDFFNHGNTLSALVGPMADKHDGNWCLRFECKNTYKQMGN